MGNSGEVAACALRTAMNALPRFSASDIRRRDLATGRSQAALRVRTALRPDDLPSQFVEKVVEKFLGFLPAWRATEHVGRELDADLGRHSD